jgi:hypothetical protein
MSHSNIKRNRKSANPSFVAVHNNHCRGRLQGIFVQCTKIPSGQPDQRIFT